MELRISSDTCDFKWCTQQQQWGKENIELETRLAPNEINERFNVDFDYNKSSSSPQFLLCDLEPLLLVPPDKQKCQLAECLTQVSKTISVDKHQFNQLKALAQDCLIEQESIES